MMTVACNSIENGRTTRSMCKVGCIGCGLCAKQSDIFIVKDNLARLDYEKYEVSKQTEYESAMNKCPTKVIICVGKADPP
jgi:ferredoxin